ncbi:MAG TPA: DUF6542 domain-containing protein [Microthrixaceae bacterium]|nr:DUF6542 domain-containing protein [Microthrixaceae bacterium]
MSVLAHAAAVLVTVAALDIALTDELGLLFDLVFIAVCWIGALAARAEDFFAVGIAPPLAMLALCGVLAVVAPGTVADPTDGPVQATVTGLAQHAVALTVGYALTLVTLAVRRRDPRPVFSRTG